MKLIHLSDLHLGKRFYDVSLIEDQKDILEKILGVIDEEKPDAVVIAGDIYDRPVPSEEAVQLFDSFLVRLADKGVVTMVISGNHDSAERLSFGNRFMKKSDVHISDVYNGKAEHIVLKDDLGNVNFYLLPFVKSINVRHYFPEEDIGTTTAALKTAVDKIGIDTSERNILVAHQFVTGASRSESEEVCVGGADNVDSDVFESFDYVALGHIHGPQNIGSEKIRYCGTPLKYSFSEAGHNKSVTVAELREKGTLDVRTVALKPLHEVAEIKGSFETLKDAENNSDFMRLKDAYLHVTLTDEDEILNAKRSLDSIYSNILLLDYDNSRTRHFEHIDSEERVQEKQPVELFDELFRKQNGFPMTEEQSSVVAQMLEAIRGN